MTYAKSRLVPIVRQVFPPDAAAWARDVRTLPPDPEPNPIWLAVKLSVIGWLAMAIALVVL